jgi:cell shape-determining protein MreD
VKLVFLKKNFRKFLPIFHRIILLELCLLLLIFPLENFRLNIESSIFPAFTVILIYYFATYYQISFGMLFLIGLVFDSLYSMPIGTNSLILIIAQIILQFSSKFFIIKNYITNFIIFCCYYFFILHSEYLLNLSKNLSSQSYLIILMHYFATIFSYNLLRIPLDSLLQYSRKHAK